MAPRTHIHIDELMALAPCDEYVRADFVTAWGGDIQTLEFISTQPFVDRPAPKEHVVWVLTGLMTRKQQVKMGFMVLDKVEKLNPNQAVRNTINLVIRFFNDTATAQEVADRRDELTAWVEANDDGSTDVKFKRFRMIDAMRNLLNPTETHRAVMTVCRLVKNHHPNATYDKFATLAIRILKEEV